jgi:ectoine hydroxylase-related dioxygenase (phytanoyl-CoA dioxygenase family)
MLRDGHDQIPVRNQRGSELREDSFVLHDVLEDVERPDELELLPKRQLPPIDLDESCRGHARLCDAEAVEPELSSHETRAWVGGSQSLEDKTGAAAELEDASGIRSVSGDRLEDDDVPGAEPEASLLQSAENLKRRVGEMMVVAGGSEAQERVSRRARPASRTRPVVTLEPRLARETALHRGTGSAGGSPHAARRRSCFDSAVAVVEEVQPLPRVHARDAEWLEKCLLGLSIVGCVVVEGVVPDGLLGRGHEAMYGVQRRIQEEVGIDRLDAAGELGVLRLMLKFDPIFFEFMEIPEVLAVVDATVSPTAILHVQNGLLLPSQETGRPDIFQTRFHRDFPRILNGYLMSINTFFVLDEFTSDNGATFFVPGTHQKEGRPEDWYLEAQAVSAECPAGSMLVFDSTIWHAAGDNVSGKDRLALNQQFTRSYVKPQIDYVRALGADTVQTRSDRTQQLLGWYTRVVTSLDDFYQPPERRLYRSGQG